jgi:hypothetical protein
LTDVAYLKYNSAVESINRTNERLANTNQVIADAKRKAAYIMLRNFNKGF